MKRLKILFLASLMANEIFAQDGLNDPSFNPTDVGFGNGYGFNNGVNALALQPNGKILALGQFSTYTAASCVSVARLNTDGTFDASFNTGNTTHNFSITSASSSLVLQPDGKMIVAGQYTNMPTGFSRLNADGSADTTFQTGTGFNRKVTAVILQPDGRIVVGGEFTSYNGVPSSHLARVNTDGTLDSLFNIGTGLNLPAQVFALVLQPDGKILVGGEFTSYNGTPSANIVRLNGDGSRDSTFNIGTGFSRYVLAAALQPDGKILAGGGFASYNGVAANGMIRLNTDGSADSTFSATIDGAPRTFVVQPDGKIIVGGEFGVMNGDSVRCLARLHADGSRDTAFLNGFALAPAYPYLSIEDMVLQADGKTIVGGFFNSYNGVNARNIMRVNQDGSIDTAFTTGPGTGFNGDIYAQAIQPDGKILAGGDFSLVNGTLRNKITRLQSDGTLDASFLIGTGFDSTITSIAIQPDGKIVVAGLFKFFNGAGRNQIARLNANGSMDTTFNPGAGFVGSWFPLARDLRISLQTDGKIIVTGEFISFDGFAAYGIARLNANGSYDQSYNTGTGFSAGSASVTIYDNVLQTDGKLLVAGYFTNYNGAFRNNIVRLNTDGTVDSTFTFSNAQTPTALELLPNGKIAVGIMNVTTGSPITILNTDGSEYFSNFDNAPLFTGFGDINDLVIQSDGKIIAIGDQPSCPFCIQLFFGGIARYNTDGTFDNTFKRGLRFSSPIYSLALQADGKVLVGGSFVSVDSIGRNRLARLLTNVSQINIQAGVAQTYCQGDSLNISFTATGSYNAGNIFTAQLSDASGNFANPQNIGTFTGTAGGIINAVIPPGATGAQYRIRVVSSNPLVTGNNNGVDIAINLVVAPAISISASDTICSGETVTFVTVSSGGGNAPTYQWKLNGNVVSTGSIYTNSTLLDGDQISCEMTSSLTCALPHLVTSNTITIQVNPLPVVAISPPSASTCEGGDITLSAAGGGVSYMWSDSSVFSFITVTPITSSSYSVTVTDFNGCSATSTAAITVNPIPVPVITQNDSLLTSSVANTYQWLVDGDSIAGANTQSYIVIQAGIYAVMVTDANGCAGISDTLSVSPSFLLSPPPSNLTAHPVLKMPQGAKVQLAWSDNSNNETGFVIFRSLDSLSGWNAVDSVTAADYLDAGLDESTKYYYKVAAYNAFGTSAFSNIASVITLTTGMNTSSDENPVDLYPNPNEGKFKLNFSQLFSSVAFVEIVNTMGQTIRKESDKMEQEIFFDISSFPKGIYLLQIQLKGGERMQKKIAVQ